MSNLGALFSASFFACLAWYGSSTVRKEVLPQDADRFHAGLYHSSGDEKWLGKART